eukprot:TRINITY_DN19565_c0_g1_i2.p1 TRINITY_DN19565_c0_g1~~TRINITY_DN19565_c0_g1_i2.p1  ORF type:complete len:113 (+),score=13.09 TRINITY_DN19565_c0_g1_i2:86-424(+)
MFAGWIDNMLLDLEDNLIVYTFPASAFVRKHYIQNGARMACADKNKHTDEECAKMADKNENCDCDVRLCVTTKCLLYFESGMCGTATAWDIGRGVTKGCYGVTGNFIGSCSD